METRLSRWTVVIDPYIDGARCQSMLDAIEQHGRAHPVPRIRREIRGRSLDYRVIDGSRIAVHLPELVRLRDDVQEAAARRTGIPLVPISSERVAINVNITSKGGEYRWHYDRNEITAILYLNAVAGGELELYGGYRIYIRGRNGWLQEKLDRLLMTQLCRAASGRHRLLQPRPGMLIIMRGVTTLHSVRPVTGNSDRICIVFAFDRQGRSVRGNEALDQYLYSEQDWRSADPNY